MSFNHYICMEQTMSLDNNAVGNGQSYITAFKREKSETVLFSVTSKKKYRKRFNLAIALAH